MRMFFAPSLSLLCVIGSMALAEPVKTISLQVTSAPEMKSYGMMTQLGFSVSGEADHFYMSCSTLPGDQLGSAEYMFQGSYGQSVRIEESHLLRDNGEFLTGIKGQENFQDCIRYLHQIARALARGKSKVILMGNADTSVAIDVQ